MNGRERSRLLVAQEAARILAREGVRDYGVAKRKAAQRLGLVLGRAMPSNLEIEDALRDYQRLFMAGSQSERLRELRHCASEAMQFLARFKPRLVGSVLSGTAGEHAGVDLHLFADTAEEVVLFLIERDIPFDDGERRFRINGEGYESYPCYRFSADGVDLELVVFPTESARHAPWSPVDGKPMSRADLSVVRRLLAD